MRQNLKKYKKMRNVGFTTYINYRYSQQRRRLRARKKIMKENIFGFW